MSRKNLCRIGHNKTLDNRELSKNIVMLLKKNGVTEKKAAQDLGLDVWKPHSWFYKGTGMTALDLLMLIKAYDFIRKAVENSLLQK